MVKVTVLGSAGSHPGNGRACSSYLVSAGDHHLLLDCGNGSMANLLDAVDPADLDAVIISHLHPDHFVDLYGLHYALRFHPSGSKTVDVHAPDGARSLLTSVLLGDAGDSFNRHLPMHVAAAGERLEIGPFDIELYAANHPIETLASRVWVDGRIIAFSGDSGTTEELIECARDVDLFICDSTWLSRDAPFPKGVHMTGTEAGQYAAAAGAERLMVTHVFPQREPEQAAADAETVYDGLVWVAADREEYEL
ncbi:MAG: MBL fold metallo-hydrolase [Actinobacteria bacterium]|nr:MBL fold metallo-hydrolase [Actinomycetota bacterium]